MHSQTLDPAGAGNGPLPLPKKYQHAPRMSPKRITAPRITRNKAISKAASVVVSSSSLPTKVPVAFPSIRVSFIKVSFSSTRDSFSPVDTIVDTVVDQVVVTSVVVVTVVSVPPTGLKVVDESVVKDEVNVVVTEEETDVLDVDRVVVSVVDEVDDVIVEVDEVDEMLDKVDEVKVLEEVDEVLEEVDEVLEELDEVVDEVDVVVAGTVHLSMITSLSSLVTT